MGPGLIRSQAKHALLQFAILLPVMMGSAAAQNATSGTPTASTQKPDSRTAAVNSNAVSTNSPDDRYALQPGEDPDNRLVSPFIKHIVSDQKEFWTSPTRFRTKDLKWILPSAGVVAAFIASDSWWSKQVNPAHMQTSLHISDYGAYSMIGLGGASFLFGEVTHNDHLRETGLLAGEAAINSTGVAYAVQGNHTATASTPGQRQR